MRRTQIADAARKVAVTYGSEHVTVRRIANEIGISEGALYRHFRSKHDILSLMVERIQEDIVSGIVKGAAGRTPLGVLESALQNHMSSIEQRKSVSFQVIAEIISLGDKKSEQAGVRGPRQIHRPYRRAAFTRDRRPERYEGMSCQRRPRFLLRLLCKGW